MHLRPPLLSPNYQNLPSKSHVSATICVSSIILDLSLRIMNSVDVLYFHGKNKSFNKYLKYLTF